MAASGVRHGYGATCRPVELSWRTATVVIFRRVLNMSAVPAIGLLASADSHVHFAGEQIGCAHALRAERNVHKNLKQPV